MKTCRVISDLHLFSGRSLAVKYDSTIQQSAASADAFVLNGDIFDFRWSTLPSTDATIEAATQWLTGLVKSYPNCQFHYVLGNHDHFEQFTRNLDVLARLESNFSWHPFYLRNGSNVFLHGDVANGWITPTRLARLRSQTGFHLPRGAIMNALYDLAIRLRLHIIAAGLAYPKHVVVRRLHAYLDELRIGHRDGVRNVYFGHTHLALDNYEINGLTFHNCGAPIAGLRFNILETTFS